MEKNRPIYRYFAYLFLSIGLSLFASCRADDFAAPPSWEENAAVFELNLPQVELAAGRSRAAAVSRINLIQTLDVLAFDADGLFYTHCQAEELYSVDGGGKWLYRIPLAKNEAQGLRFVFFANLHDEVVRAVQEGRIAKKDELYRQIEFANSDWANNSDAFPMWGETPSAYDSTSPHQDVNRVSMLRAVSTVDVVLNGNSFEAMGLDNFRLGCVEVRDVPVKGFAAPAPGHFEWEERQTDAQMRNEYVLKKATVKADAELMSLTTGQVSPSNAIRGKIIVPESDAGGAWNTTFLIGGYFENSGQLSWYRVNFSEQDKETGYMRPVDLLRNKHYVLNITRVTQAGYDTPEEACSNSSANIHAALELRPEVGNLTQMVYNATDYLATDKAELRVTEQKTDLLQILTTEAEGWRLADDMPEWLEVSENHGGQGVLAAVAFRLKDGCKGADEAPSAITLRAGSLEMSIKVYPYDENVIEYETPYVRQVWQAADFGYEEGKFVPGGSLVFLQNRYLLFANNYNGTESDSPCLLVYDMEQKQVVKKLSEWTFNGQTLSFQGTADKSDQIDDLVADERNNRLYVMRRQSCVEVFDISNPLQPEYVTRIGKPFESGTTVRNRLSGSGAILPAENYLLLRDNMSLDTYLYEDIVAGKFQEITCVTRDNMKMTHTDYHPTQWAVDPTDGSIYMTEYDNAFQGIYSFDLSKADPYVQAGKYWQQQDLRSRALPLAYQPTGLLITDRKVYVTRLDGSLDIFSRKILEGAPAVRASVSAEKAENIRLRTSAGRFGKLQKIYLDPNDAECFWSIDMANRTLVQLNMFKSNIEIQP